MELNALLAQPVALPSLPRTVALLMNELAHPQPSLRRINLLFGSDPALAARLLELANSPALQMPRQVAGISEALALLGNAQVRALVAASTLGTAARSVPGINLQQFWAYSLNVAKLARSLAGVVRQNQQAAFTCGLIHAVGELALHIAMPAMSAVLDSEMAPLDLRRAKAERRSYGFCYAQVGAGFASQWHFPQAMVDALAHQYAPFENEVYEPLAGVIHLAAWRARAWEASLSERELAVTFPGPVGEVLGLDIDMVLQQDPIDWSAQTPGRNLI